MKRVSKIAKHKRKGKAKPNRQYKDSVFVDLFSLDEITKYDAVMPLHKVRHYKELYGDAGYTVAIEECIKEGMELSEYLGRKMREVVEMFSAEYSYALELEASKEDGMREGIAIGLERGREEGIERGIERGREEGRLARTISLARSFRDMGVSVDKISKATGLSEDEIASL